MLSAKSSQNLNLKARVFFIVGDNFFKIQYLMERIEQRLSFNPNSLNTLTFYGKDLEIETLRDSLMGSPFQRLLLFKGAEFLSGQIKEFLVKNLERIAQGYYLVFIVEKDPHLFFKDKAVSADKLFSLLLRKATLFRIASLKEISIEDFSRALRIGNLKQALYILERLFKGRIPLEKLGPQILGILVKAI